MNGKTLLLAGLLLAGISPWAVAQEEGIQLWPPTEQINFLPPQEPSSLDELLPPDLVAADAAGPIKPAPKPAAPATPAIKYPTVIVTGFAQIDSIWLDQDPASEAINGDIQDFADFRRARLAAKGQLADNVGYFLEMDFAFPGRPTFMDVWVEYQNPRGLGNIRIGHFRQPLSMDGLTSVRDLTFMERSLPFIAFVPFRQIGVEVYNSEIDDLVTWAVSAYRFPTDTYGNAFGDSGYGMGARVTAAPVYEEESNAVVHVGYGFSHNNPGDSVAPTGAISNNVARYRTTPEIGFTNGEFFNQITTGPFFVDTGNITNVSTTNIFGLEAAGSYGAFLLQAEFFDVRVNRSMGSDRTFTGAYAQASYVLTGEYRKYNKKGACFGRVIPAHPLGDCGWGAWELAGRWSYVDLTNTPVVTPLAGRLTDFTAGVNWYWNAYAKMQFNWIHAEQNLLGANDPNTNIYAIRTQFDF